MIEVEVEPGPWKPGTTCRCRTRIRAPRPTPALRIVATVTAFEATDTLLRSEPATNRVLYSRTVELLPAAHYESCELPFDVRIPDFAELEFSEEAPAFGRRLTSRSAPGRVDPIRFEVEVRMERRWRRDCVARAEIELELAARALELRAS